MRRIISAVVGGGVAIFAGANAMDDNTTRNDTGQIVEDGGLGVLAIHVGDCLQLPEEVEVQSVHGVPCGEPHDAQVFAEFDLPDGPFPGEAAVDDMGGQGCYDRWQGAIGTVYEDDQVLDFVTFTPIEAGWAQGDHETQCLVVRIDRTQMVGDVLNG